MIRRLDGGIELDDDPERTDLEAVHRFISKESYWGGERTLELHYRMHAASFRVIGAYGPQGQIGYARAISDGVAFAYLADVFVIEQMRGRGIATEMLRELIDNGPLAGMLWMLNTLDAHGLYERLGFTAPRYSAMERRPASGAATERAL